MIQWNNSNYPISLYYLRVDFIFLHTHVLVSLVIFTKIYISYLLTVHAFFG